MSRHKKFEGTSSKGNFQEALDHAIAAAQAAEPGADMITNWRLERVRGKAGGIAGLTEITVEIETP
ncbi:MAG: hypothetical protein ACJ8GN_20185 [Longimicrobiaceae bacterium]